MDKSNPPTTFGIFKPTHHTLIAFYSPEALQAARQALYAEGFSAAAMSEYTAQEMLELADAELATHSPLAIFGYEVNLLRKNRELAERGCGFLVVHAPEEEQAQKIADLVHDWKPAGAQHFGRFLIEDLVERQPG